MKTPKTIVKEILIALPIFLLSIFLISCGSMVFIMTLGPFLGWIGPEDFGGLGVNRSKDTPTAQIHGYISDRKDQDKIERAYKVIQKLRNAL